MSRSSWERSRQYTPETLEAACLVLDDLCLGREYLQAIRSHTLADGGYVPKHTLVAAYRRQVELGEMEEDPTLLAQIRMKPIRTLSGVTTVTVLTKPYPCPGNCIFCPDDLRLPKSYLIDEPGAARAFQNQFDPYLQVRSRLDLLLAVGHPVDKIELLILGGTWSAYPRDYQEWFVLRCFDALNGVDSKTLAEAQAFNEGCASRNVGLVIETRPDWVRVTDLPWLRELGVTKVQLGAQSLDDGILALNQRGHGVAELRYAVELLRAAAFKIVLHWMPNLLGATLDSDHEDFQKLWQGYCPDELKIYPTSLLESTELYRIWEKGGYRPYSTAELISLIADLKPSVPPYCRINRVIRDIPSTHVVEGNKRTSLRQDILAELERREQACGCIRCHEVRAWVVVPGSLKLEDFTYAAFGSEEHFLHYRTPDGGIAGYLRLSFPEGEVVNRVVNAVLPELHGAALVREVHVYGQALAVGDEQKGATQHTGLGKQLLEKAEELAREKGNKLLAVISAVGTREYYEKRGFRRDRHYHIMDLD